ncbi:hypothetical protein LTR78_005527 [Recurvomyces mirabilis]|uniref:Uncharacterized protein n=1 Tax=Recurvomyces mirabilis TaxID=574656 RepID=A0AAE1C136_9PEZI|nr:hypothetical protein LTR78_005527 [Recurvomyces mirabilis]KAK5158482.1 hypothetical protein LTS14_003501 [Recurvomyces mirabilis]
MSSGYIILELNIRDGLLQSLRSVAPWARLSTIQKTVNALATPALSILREEAARSNRPNNPPLTLLTLPPELRNRIWKICVVDQPDKKRQHGHGIQITKARNVHLVTGVTPSALERCVKQPAISRVCRQSRVETLPIFYGLNTFMWRRMYRDWCAKVYGTLLTAPGAEGRTDTTTLSDAAVLKWLNAIGDGNRAGLKSLVLQWYAVDLPEKRAAEIEVARLVDTGKTDVKWECVETGKEFWYNVAIGC